MSSADDAGHRPAREPESAPPDAMSLQEYLDAQAAAGGHSTIPFSDVLRPFMSPSVRLRAKQVATAVATPVSRRRAREHGLGSPLRLHLGSGGNNIPGWVNIDLVGATADVAWDLRRPLPFPDRAASAVFLEHVLEHMTVAEGMAVLRHAFRVLAPGGVIRVGVPDAGLYARSYAGGDGTLDELRPGRPTRMLALGEVFQEHGHVSAWDGETLVLVVGEVGFVEAEVTPGGTSRIEPAPDSPVRIPETVYVEAVVPGP
ncbi:MAG: methyltransferase domain-containing protein [Acidimicrobiales bacterium]|jgi:SAM-dependent methyltransferase